MQTDRADQNLLRDAGANLIGTCYVDGMLDDSATPLMIAGMKLLHQFSGVALIHNMTSIVPSRHGKIYI